MDNTTDNPERIGTPSCRVGRSWLTMDWCFVHKRYVIKCIDQGLTTYKCIDKELTTEDKILNDEPSK